MSGLQERPLGAISAPCGGGWGLGGRLSVELGGFWPSGAIFGGLRGLQSG